MKQRTLAIAALVGLALVWGDNWVLMKYAVQDASPFAFAAERALGGGAVLFAFAMALRKPLRPERPFGYAVLGLFQIAGFLGLVTCAVVTAGAGKVAMLAYTMPFWVTLLARPLLGERLRFLQGVAIAIAFGGIACMIVPLHGAWIADVMAVCAGISWAIGVIIVKRLQREAHLDLYNMTMWQMLFGGVILLAIAFIMPSRATVWSATYIWILAYNVLPATAIGYVLWIFVLRVLPARDASMGTLTVPLLAVVSSWAFLGERPSVIEGTGMVLVAVGLLLLTFADRFLLPGIPVSEYESVADDEQAG
ncbi:MAG: DMT family transporter [Vulcanimicrobiaceae bacterium]